MIKRLVEFARLLRQSGVRVSMAETLDAAEVLPSAGEARRFVEDANPVKGARPVE